MRTLFALLLCAAAPAPAEPAPAGTISGKVTIQGLAPKLAPLPVTRDNKFCGVNKPDEALLVGAGGGLKNAVLWVPGVPAPKDAPRARARLEQQGCRFEPHVMVAPAGVTLEVVNSDAVLHHPKAMAGEQKVFDFPMPLKGYTVPRRLEKAELVRVTCETHPWMKAFVQVLDSGAYAITDEQGGFSIAGVPAGKHKLRLWHERLGEREEEIEVAPGATLKRDISLPPR